MNFEGELVILPYAQYFLQKTCLCPFRHRPAEVSDLKICLREDIGYCFLSIQAKPKIAKGGL